MARSLTTELAGAAVTAGEAIVVAASKIRPAKEFVSSFIGVLRGCDVLSSQT
jgi:zinc transporter ZupT